MLVLISSCQPQDKNEDKLSTVNIRLAEGSIKANISIGQTSQVGVHLLRLVKENVFDGASISVKNNIVTITPDKNINPKLSQAKVPAEMNSLQGYKEIWGLIKSPILEQGDSRLFICFKSCEGLGSEYIIVGNIIEHTINIDKIQTGQKVLAVLEL